MGRTMPTWMSEWAPLGRRIQAQRIPGRLGRQPKNQNVYNLLGRRRRRVTPAPA